LDTGIDWGDGVAIPIVILDYYHKIMIPRRDRAGNPIEPSPMRAAEMAFVVHLLGHHPNTPTGKCTPSLKVIATEMGISRMQVLRYKNALERAGLIEVTYRDHATSVYGFRGLMIAAKAAEASNRLVDADAREAEAAAKAAAARAAWVEAEAEMAEAAREAEMARSRSRSPTQGTAPE